ncbi:MAG: DUF58 domain-containing protein [Deltaproteobacteria bacterium]|nr:DUF58 domain-containing protein [Deltaproteobacteria bacterium]
MISKELVRKLRVIEIHTSKLATEQLAGSYHSVFKGRGISFSEVRQYQPGDDVRFIDWNVTARMNDTYVKLFTEEREMTVMLLVDLSASERFGSRNQPKAEIVAEVAALFAFSAIKNNDRVGLILFTDRVERVVPPKKGQKHVMRVIAEILAFRPQGRGTNLREALEVMGSVSRRRSVAFLISDFGDHGYEHALRVSAARHDLIPVTVMDPVEEELPDVGLVMVEDLETGEVAEIDTSDRRVREAYQARIARERVAREAMFRRLSVDPVTVRTDRPYLPPLVDFFRRRKSRLRR